MSLINEALKKAQRLRTGDQGDPTGSAGGVHIAKRSRPRSANTMVLLGAGAIMLVVVSVVLTVYLVNRPAAPAPALASAPVATQPATTQAAPPPVVVIPEIKLPAVATAAPAQAPAAVSPLTPIAPAPAVVASSAAPTPPAAAPPASSPSDSSTAAAPAVAGANAEPAAPARPNERVAAFVDSIRVTATRAAEGKVLMNDRVYRENEVVERTLGVRLLEVAIDRLTFADANGVTYVKYF